MNSHLFVCVCFCCFFSKSDVVTFEAISQLFCSSDLFSFCIRQEGKVVVREYVCYWGDLWGEKEYSEFFVYLIHAQHIN